MGLAPSYIAGRLARVRLHYLADLRLRELPCGPKTKQNAGADGNQDREDKHGHIELDRRFVRKRKLRQIRSNHPDSFVREQDPKPGARKRKKQRFRQQLANDSDPARAYCRAHRKLMLPRSRPCQQKDRDIGATDHQQQGDRAKQQIERAPKIFHELFVETNDVKSLMFFRRIESRRLACKFIDQRLQGCIRLHMGYTRFESHLSEIVQGLILRNFQGKINVPIVPREARRGYPDDEVVLVIQLDVLPRTPGSALKWRCQNL